MAIVALLGNDCVQPAAWPPWLTSKLGLATGSVAPLVKYCLTTARPGLATPVEVYRPK